MVQNENSDIVKQGPGSNQSIFKFACLWKDYLQPSLGLLDCLSRILLKTVIYKMFMPVEEQEEFSLYLSNAIEDLINARPQDPTKYLAIALLRQIPEQEWSEDFPEILQEVRETSEEQVRMDSAREEFEREQDRERPQVSNRRRNI